MLIQGLNELNFRNLHLCSSSLQYNPDFLFNPISLIIHNLLIEWEQPIENIEPVYGKVGVKFLLP